MSEIGREIEEARAAGYAYGQNPVGRYAEGYTGAYITGEPGAASAEALYGAYCEGYCSSPRVREEAGRIAAAARARRAAR